MSNNIPGSAPLGAVMRGRGGDSGLTPEQAQEQRMIRYMTAFMESCPAKMALSGGAGFVLGGGIGFFMASMRYDTPALNPALNPSTAATFQNLPWRTQLRHGLADMGRSAYSSARNFGLIGGMFSGVECGLEGLRGRNELANGVAAGCITGGVLARNGGLASMGVGCAGFAAFSSAIELYLRMPESDQGGRID